MTKRPSLSERITKAAAACNPRQRKFADLVLGGVPAGRAYEEAGYKVAGAMADTAAAQALRFPRVSAYMAAVRDEAASLAVLDQTLLNGLALEVARGSDAINPSQQIEAIRFLDGVLARGQLINIPDLVIHAGANEAMVADIAFTALEHEVRGVISHDQAHGVISNCALVQQIMHGATLAAEIRGNLMTISTDETALAIAAPAEQPVRPKWLKSPAAVAAVADAKAKKKPNGSGGHDGS